MDGGRLLIYYYTHDYSQLTRSAPTNVDVGRQLIIQSIQLRFEIRMQCAVSLSSTGCVHFEFHHHAGFQKNVVSRLSVELHIPASQSYRAFNIIS